LCDVAENREGKKYRELSKKATKAILDRMYNEKMLHFTIHTEKKQKDKNPDANHFLPDQNG
jgi:hypothetical protein